MKAISEGNAPAPELLQRRLFLKWSAASFLALGTIPALSLKARAGEGDDDDDDDDDRPSPKYDPREYRDDDEDEGDGVVHDRLIAFDIGNLAR
jgi:hypothetical protein